ncbi:hypothetical protein LPY66_08210 [Dehalobacter sp. DCM]|uniref:hypothetical protein n=1 Tax=Dehalobacter sp. DCM TaxID=2907827 RepID=UPI003081ACF3|nr:hypothetical protein LPY66_08210 [Dehalobacter sp. DCM]
MLGSPYHVTPIDLSDIGNLPLKEVLPDPATWLPAYLQFGRPLLTMPKGPELFVTILFGLGSLATLCYGIYLIKKSKSLWPLWLMLGGILCTFYEFFDSQTLHFMYPQVGDWTALVVWGFSIPVFLVLIYPFYVTFLVLFNFHQMEMGKLTVKRLWLIYAISFVGAMCFEPLAIHNGLWYYYGPNQPFAPMDFPIIWWFANPAMIILVGPIVHFIWNKVLNRRFGWVMIPMVPFFLFALHNSIALPLTFTINSTLSLLATNLGQLGAIALSFGTVAVGALFTDKYRVKDKEEVKVAVNASNSQMG